MESVEASGKSIEDAILQALARLGRNRNEVEIAVLQEPSRGQRGMGSRDARVRVHVKPTYANRPPAAPEESSSPFDDTEELVDPLDEYAVQVEEAYGEGIETDPYAPGEAIYSVQEIATTPLKDLLSADASIEEVAVE